MFSNWYSRLVWIDVMEVMRWSCSQCRMELPLETSHSLTRRSAPPVATTWSTGLHRTALTSLSWASWTEPAITQGASNKETHILRELGVWSGLKHIQGKYIQGKVTNVNVTANLENNRWFIRVNSWVLASDLNFYWFPSWFL